MSRIVLDASLVHLALLALVAQAGIAWSARRPFSIADGTAAGFALFAGAAIALVVPASLIAGSVAGALATAALAIGAFGIVRLALPRLSNAGALDFALAPLMLLVAIPWSLLLLDELAFPRWCLMLALFGGAIGVLTIGFTLAGALARGAMMTHARWRRPTAPLAPGTGGRPRVSIHLPCYSEPPALVRATLDRLAALEHADFEVLVCDNNTQDEALWRPIEAHCMTLNRACGQERFRFFHVAKLAGAKAGALNYCLDRTDPSAELVAVLDADYLAEPDFLARLTGFFDDPALGYIQTPHDYRDWQASAYSRACYWEYMPTNKVVMPGIADYGAGFTIGTMCVLRTDAIRQAGGWAEWCLTEDSEISVRLRAIGYEGLYLADTFGRGLIPETFADYRKQRFRWTAGPVQQLRRYWRWFLPAPFGEPSRLNGWSKLLEFQRSAAPVVSLIGTPLGLIGALAALWLTASGIIPSLDLPNAAWAAAAALGAGGLLRSWRRYRLSGCESIADMALAELAQASLAFVQMSAAVAGMSSRPQPWRRTPKFAGEHSGLRALTDTAPETALALVHLLVLALYLQLGDAIGGDLLAIALIGMAASGLRFLAAPAMALLGERRLARLATSYDEMFPGLPGLRPVQDGGW